MPDYYMLGPESREAAFEREWEGQRKQIHRLREWESGDTLWGYVVCKTDGSSFGKTFTHEAPGGTMGADAARRAFESAAAGNTLTSNEGSVAFYYMATVHNPQTEPRGMDDEPPLKMATMKDVVVKDSAEVGES